MKIALATWFPVDPASPSGGVETVSVNLAKALAEIPGNEVHVIAFDRKACEIAREEWAGVKIHRLPLPPGSLLGFSKGKGRRILQSYLRDLSPDIVHAHDTFGIMTRGLDLPRVFTIHGFIHEDTRLQGGLGARLRSLLWKREELAVWREQPHIISISPYVRERLRGIARGVIHDIENPIDAECFAVKRSEDAGLVFSAAVICRRKNSQALVEALALIPDRAGIRLCLAGPVGEADYGAALRRKIAESGLDDRVELPGSLASGAVRAQLSRAAVFALVSFEEGAPMGIAEAMAAGIPILTSNRCGMPYMVRHGETGFLVEPDDIDDIAKAMARLLADPALRQSMGEAARKRAIDGFHPERVASRTMAVYEMAIARSHA